MNAPFFTKMISALFLLSLILPILPASAEEPCPLTGEQVYPVLADLIFVVFDLNRDGKITRQELAVISPDLANSGLGDFVGDNGTSRWWVQRYMEILKPLNMIDTNRNGLIEYEEVGDDVPREIFDMLDFNANGVIDCEDFDYLTEEYTEAEGDEECGSSDILALIARGGVLYLDQDGDDLISQDEIIVILSESGDLGSNADTFHALFNMLDADKDGYLSAVEIHGTLLSIPINVIHIVDTNRDGAIQYLEVPFVPLTLFAQLDTVPDGKLDCADYIDQYENNEIELPKGALGGVVRDAKTQLPLSGVTVKVSPGGFSDTTLAVVGTFGFPSLPYRQYTLTATKEGYQPYSKSFRMDTLVLTLDILLEPEVVVEGEVEGEIEGEIEGEEPVLAHVAGVVRDEATGLPVSDVLITLIPGDFTVHSLDILGTFLINDIPPGIYTITAEKEGYFSYEQEITLDEGEIEPLDIQMIPEPIVEGEEIIEGEIIPEGEELPVEGESVPDDRPKGALSGVVRNAATELPVPNAALTLMPGGYQAVSQEITGLYRIAEVPFGTYTLHVAHPAFENHMTSVEIKQTSIGPIAVTEVLLDVVLTMKTGEGETIATDVEGEAVPHEGETLEPVEGEAAPSEGETLEPVEGETIQPEGERPVLEGEQPSEGEDDDVAPRSGCNGRVSVSSKSLADDWFPLISSFLALLFFSVFGKR
ncbi:MAG: hypothetical protein GX130_02960 [Candidatus Hydrogenedens sp.]|jgi:Ca2+-binding EF-hand superfamily protein|nr:hypothetical protein [Candidatus Hydrogenedens sp.]